MATSPTSCGISCAATAIAVLTPSGTDVSTAVAMIAPSMKLWNASPKSTSGAAAPCTWHSSVWQWRSSTSFSSMKNTRMPASSVPNTARRRQRLERLGQQRQQRDAKQRTDRVADQPRHERVPNAVGEKEERRGDEQAADAAQKAQPQGGREKRHVAILSRDSDRQVSSPVARTR